MLITRVETHDGRRKTHNINHLKTSNFILWVYEFVIQPTQIGHQPLRRGCQTSTTVLTINEEIMFLVLLG